MNKRVKKQFMKLLTGFLRKTKYEKKSYEALNLSIGPKWKLVTPQTLI